MWKVDELDESRKERQQRLHKKLESLHKRGISEDLAVRVKIAFPIEYGEPRHFNVPPKEIYKMDFSCHIPSKVLDIEDLTITNEWLTTLAAGTVVRVQGARNVSVCKKMILSGTAISDVAMTNFQKFRNIRHLDISRCHSLTDDSMDIIRRQLGQLEILHINDCRTFSSDILCLIWRDCTRLHSISAKGCPGITDNFLQTIANTRRSAPEYTAKSLDFRHCKNLSSSGVSYLASSTIKDLNLISLSIGECLDIDSMAFFGFETSLGLQNLEVLDLRDLNINETAISWIVQGMKRLRRLNLANCEQINDFAVTLLAPLIKTLKYLNLKGCTKITDTGIKDLFQLPQSNNQNEQQQGKHFRDDYENDDGDFDDLDFDDDDDDLYKSPLESLNVGLCVHIGDEGLKSISRMCPKLQKLDVKGLRRVSDQGITSIAKYCPHLTQIKLSGRYVTLTSYKLLGRICRKIEAIDISERLDLEPTSILGFTATCKTLRKINLMSSNVCDVSMSIIAYHCRDLQWINLSKCQKITDLSINAIASTCFGLKSLFLSYSKGITNLSIDSIAKSQLPLEEIDLTGNTNITDVGLKTLCQNCQTIRELCIKGCIRLSVEMIKTCHGLLPYVAPLVSSTTSTLARSRKASTISEFVPLPSRHIELIYNMVRYYECATILQDKFRRWKQKEASMILLAKRRHRRETRAARIIQKAIRQFLSWRNYLRMMSLQTNLDKVIKVQATMRGKWSRHSTKILRFTINRAARCIQRHYRPHYTIRMRFLSANALQIQRVYRGYLGRKKYQRLLHWKHIESANYIGSWYRRAKQWVDFRARSRALMSKVKKLQTQWRIYSCRKKFRHFVRYYTSRATKIQSVIRMALTIRRVRVMRIMMNAAATKIQRIYKGFFTCKRFRQYGVLVHASSTKIQATWRGYSKKKRYFRMRLVIVKHQRYFRHRYAVSKWRKTVYTAIAKRRHEAAICIQRHVRGRRGRKRAILFRKIRNAKLARQGQNAVQYMLRERLMKNGAAVRIQRWVRRIHGRRSMFRLRRWKRFAAANCIQRQMNLWITEVRTRRKRERKMHSALNIQRVFRGHLGRIKFKKEKRRQLILNCVQLIQRAYRGHLGRKAFKKRKYDMITAATMVQRMFRTRQSQKLYEISRAARALKAKERYDKSILGRLDAKKNPMDELYKRARMLREKALLVEIKKKWEANRIAQERALRKLRREAQANWSSTNQVISNYYSVKRKLYGVTENVYSSHLEFTQRQARNEQLEKELTSLHIRMIKFKAALREAVETRRMLEGTEIYEILRAHNLYIDQPEEKETKKIPSTTSVSTDSTNNNSTT